MRNSAIASARSAALAALIAVPTGLAFAADDSATRQPAPPRQQAQAVVNTPAVAPAANGRDVSGDDPYVTARGQEKFYTGRAAPTRFSNEPDWSSPEYISR
jgi:hypothetical protein